jgi:dimethylamine/trimethylamine dehydrogenase
MWRRCLTNVGIGRNGLLTELKTDNQVYLKTLLVYFEEEIMGEAYFHGLAEHFEKPEEREKLILMGKVERYAAESVRSLINKYNLTPRPDDELHAIGEKWIERHVDHEWLVLMSDISVRYHDYMVQFHALEGMAPKEDLPALNILTDHEVAAIEFADLEVAGAPDSVIPLLQYLAGTYTGVYKMPDPRFNPPQNG